jgi:tripartite-type tricarboxylate transporter receptor subunit TctC
VVQHLAMALLLQETGASMIHVPYKGAAGAMTDLMGGHVQASVVALQTTSSLIQSGQLQMLAVMSDERSAVFPKVPTLKELGYPNLVVDTWYGIFAPAGTPPEAVGKLNNDFNTLLQLPDVREAMTKHGLSPAGGKPERLGQLLSREVTRWKQVVSTAHIQAD